MATSEQHISTNIAIAWQQKKIMCDLSDDAVDNDLKWHLKVFQLISIISANVQYSFLGPIHLEKYTIYHLKLIRTIYSYCHMPTEI